MSKHTPLSQRGFTLIELMVTIAVIAIVMGLTVPQFGSAVRNSRERTVVQRLAQDFSWARGAAGAGNASVLGAGLSGAPTVQLIVNADCSWSVTVNGTALTNHSMATGTLASTAPHMTCTSTAALPATFTFTSQGLVNTTGTITYVGAGAQSYPLQVFSSGTALRLSPVAGTQS